MTDRELMQQALDALTRIWEDGLENYPVAAHESVMDALREMMAQPEQEPFAWLYRDSWGTMKLSQVTPPPVGAFPVYTTPPQRKPLTDEDIKNTWVAYRAALPRYLCFARSIEAAHGIKENT